jgi:prolycopene isomerase
MGISTTSGYDVIVVGAGLGGLSCALHFARGGFHVLVLEKQPKVGGYAQNYQRSEYSFDVSLHVLSAMNPAGGLRRLLDHLQVTDRLEIRRREPMFTSVFPDASYELPGGAGPAGDYLKSRFPGEAAGIDRFVESMERVVGDNTRLFWEGEADLDSFFPARYFKRPYRDLLDDCVSDPRLHGLLGQLWQSTGLPNSRCAANWAAEVFGSHLLTGNYYLRGGGQQLSLAMARALRDAGSVVREGAFVSRILHADRTVHGVELETGERFRAPVIVCNANPLQTYFELIGREHLSKAYIYKLEHLEPSCSLLTIYLGLDCPGSTAGVDRHTLFVNGSYDNDVSYRLAMAEDYARTDYVISDYTDDGGGCHPPGRGIVQILEAAPGAPWTEIPRPEYEEKKRRVLDTILDKVSRRYPALREHVAVCEMGTPRTMALATRNPFGCVYGWAQTPDQADNHRFPVASVFKGLYFTGAWSRGGGGGYMGAVVNGRVAWRQAMEREGWTSVDTRIPARRRVTRAAAGEERGFTMERYARTLAAEDLSPLGELGQAACVRMLGESADRYVRDRADLLREAWPDTPLEGTLHASFFQMRLVFVPFAALAPGAELTLEIEARPLEPGKVELLVNVFDRAGRKLANAGGRALVRAEPA